MWRCLNMDIKDIYKQLTDVDIEEQKRLWDERGKGYYGGKNCNRL